MTTLREELRAALDESVLKHTGRSIGDVASQQVVDDIWPLIEAQPAHESRVGSDAPLSDEAQTLDVLRYDIEWTCPDCGSVLNQYAVANPGVSWRACPRCGGRMHLRMTSTNLAINQDKEI